MSPRYKRRLRGSQAITTFGPGGIVDLREESVMLAGLDFWHPLESTRIAEPNLEALLRVRNFHSPPPAGERFQKAEATIPYVLFPEWLVCPGCERLAPYPTFLGIFPGTRPPRCDRCNRQLYPARLIVACRAGHIDDFPWEWWVHEAQGKTCTGKPALGLKTLGRTATLGDLLVYCKTCKETRTLAGATYPENLAGLSCSGKQPWLRDREACTEKPVPLQRGASNVYFPIVVSGLSIPPWSGSVQLAIGRHWDLLRNLAQNSPQSLQPTIEGLDLPAKTAFSVRDILDAVQKRLDNEAPDTGRVSESDLRFQEHLALRSPHMAKESDELEVRETLVDQTLASYFSRVRLVTRLREVRALIGFTRVFAPDPMSRLETKVAPLSRQRKPWLPAIEVHGEGIYIELDEDAVASWSREKRVQSRAGLLKDTYVEMCGRRHWQPKRPITPRLLLVHSLAHLLIRQLSLECGYSSASLRERLYVFEPDTESGRPGVAALLIYTAAVDSDGSLGGLVRQGLPERLTRTLKDSIQAASWCASDPLCLETEGQGPDALNLAACHACLLVSETSCEEFNRFLDRATLIGPPSAPEAGFFSELLSG